MKPPVSPAAARALLLHAIDTWSPQGLTYLATIAGFGEPAQAAALNLCVDGERDTDPGGIPCVRPAMPGLAHVLAGVMHVYRELDRATYGRPWAQQKATPRGATLDSETMARICAEVRRGRGKFPGGRFLLAGLVEEVGELVCAILAGNPKAIRDEAMQVAGVASRIAEEGDRTPYRADGFAEMVYALGGVARHAMQRKPSALRVSLLALYNATDRMLAGGDRTFDNVTDEEAQP